MKDSNNSAELFVMESKLRVFTCTEHKDELVQRISMTDSSSRHLFCAECLQTQQHTFIKPNLLHLEDYISFIVRESQKIQQLSISKASSLPEEIKKFIDNEKRLLMEFQMQAENQKARVKDKFNMIIKDITKLLTTQCDQIIKEFDEEVFKLRINIEQIRATIDIVFKGETKSCVFQDKNSFIEKINDCTTPSDFDAFIRTVNRGFSVLSSLKTEAFDRMLKVKRESVLHAVRDLNQQIKHGPSIPLLGNLDVLIKYQIENLSNTVSQLSVIERPLKSIIGAGPLESSIASNINDHMLITKWIHPGGSVDYQLLYRGTRDGFSAAAFHEKCDMMGPTLILCKSNLGKVFGGFTETAWDSKEPEDLDFFVNPENENLSRCFLFSLSQKQKYPPKTYKNSDQDVFSGSYSLKTTGPCFGQGDLSIPSHCNVEKSASMLGVSFWVPPGTNKLDQFSYLGGAQSFQLEEIEVFLVFYDRGAPIEDEVPDECQKATMSLALEQTPY